MTDTETSRIYIAGPMTGIKDYNFSAFHAADARLRHIGWTDVINPSKLDDGDTSKPYEYYMKRDIAALLDCTAIYMLLGWENSKGARLEHSIADTLGLELKYESENQELHKKVNEEATERLSETILAEAARLVDGIKQEDYGHPKKDFSRTAKLWSGYFGFDVTMYDVPMCLILMKVSRQKNLRKRDNPVDIAGYARTVEKLDE